MKGWRPTKRGLACAACGDMEGYCTVSDKGDVCQCRHGVESKVKVPQRSGGVIIGYAYLHPMDGGTATPQKQSHPTPPKPKLTEAELAKRSKMFQSKFTGRHVTRASESLGLSEASLRQYGCGYDADSDCLTFPMFCGDQHMIGIRTRHFGDAVKRCVAGSRNGLFIPADFNVAVVPDSGVDDEFEPLLILTPEGPTDAAACFACGFQAIGRPNNSSGAEMLARLLRRCVTANAPRDIVVIADADAAKWAPDGTPSWPGWEGAVGIAAACIRLAASVRVVLPPNGVKDMRAAVLTTAVDSVGVRMVTAIAAADPWDAREVERKRRAIELRKAVAREMLAGRTFADDAGRDASRADALREAKALVVTGKADGWLAGRRAVASAA